MCPRITTYREVSCLSKGTQLMNHRAKVESRAHNSDPDLFIILLSVTLTCHTILNKGNPHTLGINTDLYNFSGGQPDSTYQILTFDPSSTPSRNDLTESLLTYTKILKNIHAVYTGKPKGIRQACSSIWQGCARHSIFLKPSTQATKWDLASGGPELHEEQQL